MSKSTLDGPMGYSVEGILALAGGAPAVAAKLGLTVQTVVKWDRRIPGAHAQTVAIMAGLPIEIVRPDFVSPKGRSYQAKQQAAAQAKDKAKT